MRLSRSPRSEHKFTSVGLILKHQNKRLTEFPPLAIWVKLIVALPLAFESVPLLEGVPEVLLLLWVCEGKVSRSAVQMKHKKNTLTEFPLSTGAEVAGPFPLAFGSVPLVGGAPEVLLLLV